jgi:hypothetical protein
MGATTTRALSMRDFATRFESGILRVAAPQNAQKGRVTWIGFQPMLPKLVLSSAD